MHIAIDLDGTLLEYTKGMGEARKLGTPLPWALPFIEKLAAAGHEWSVFTSRDPGQHLMIRGTLKDLGFPAPRWVTNVKQKEFTLIIDDRAVNFPRLHDECISTCFGDHADELLSFRTWWEKIEDMKSEAGK